MNYKHILLMAILLLLVGCEKEIASKDTKKEKTEQTDTGTPDGSTDGGGENGGNSDSGGNSDNGSDEGGNGSDKGGNNGGNGNDNGADNGGNGDTPDLDELDGALSIAEAQEAIVGTFILVKGYIVAATTRAMSNMDFTAPFEGSSAIVLADEPSKKEDQYNGPVGYSQYFPVCLTDRKANRAELNLEDNPGHWNHLIYIWGIKSTYLRVPGLKQTEGYVIIP